MGYVNKKRGEMTLPVAIIVLVFLALSMAGLLYIYKDNLDKQHILEENRINKEEVISKSISFLSFGDAMFDRGVKMTMDKGKDPFEFMKGGREVFLNDYDFKTLNLEGPITTSEIGQGKVYNFKFEPKVAEILKENNFNLVNLANNHMLDYYSTGHEDTKLNLDKYGIDYFGGFEINDSYKIKTIGDKKIAFIGIDESTAPIKISDFYPLIKKLKAENDFVVVNIHWGYEYDFIPSEIQKNIGHNLIDNGADVIIGHHPHVIQPVEIYKNGVIFYSLGNFIFDQVNSYSRKGFGVGAILENNKKTFYLFPYEIINNQPKLYDGQKSSEFCSDYLVQINGGKDCYFETNAK